MKLSMYSWFFSYSVAIGFFIGFITPILINYNKAKSVSYLWQQTAKEIAKVPTFPRMRVLFGVMTAEKYLNERAMAISKSWGNSIPTGSDLYFFVSDNSSAISVGLPAIRLKGVNDDYPPQRKSFNMFKYFHETWGDKYDWFVRVDDDTFVKVERLLKFLSSLNPNRPHYIGQPGYGKKHELGKMNLTKTETFCMGGPSVIVSRQTVALLAPHVQTCLSNLFTLHEDVEVGRCIARYVGKTCTVAYDAKNYFYNSHVTPVGKAFAGNLNVLDVHRGLTLHPVKTGVYQYRLARIAGLNRAQKLRHRLSKLKWLLSTNSFSFRNHLLNTTYQGRDRNSIQTWDFFNSRKSFYIGHELPSIKTTDDVNMALVEAKLQIVEMLNLNSSKTGVVTDSVQIQRAFRRVHPILGADYVFDLFTKNRHVRGFKSTSRITKKHLYYRQSFAMVEIKNEGTFSVNSPDKQTCVNVIMTVAGRQDNFIRFAKRFEKEFLETNENVSWTIIFFSSANEEGDNTVKSFIYSLKSRYPHARILFQERMKGEAFSKTIAYQYAAGLFGPDDLIFFIDVDLALSRSLLYRARTLVQKNQSAYMPIVFSLYNPNSTKLPADSLEISDNSGFWRVGGYGMVALYGSDFNRSGGFDLTIKGWGKEDVDFAQNVIQTGVNVIRAPDPSLIHVFHPVICSAETGMDKPRLAMCEATKFLVSGNRRLLARQLLDSGIIHKKKAVPN